MPDEIEPTTEAAEPAAEEKPKRRRTRKPKAEATKAPPKQAKRGKPDPELEILDEDEDALPPDHVAHNGATITLNGDVALRVMTLEDQKQHGVKSIAGEMGKKCKKAPLVITFKTPKAALGFFDFCLYAETEADEFIQCGKKVEWDSPSMSLSW